MISEKEKLINEFEDEMKRYHPNWNTIIEINNIPTETFGIRLKELRKKRGHTQEFVGERLFYSKQAINKIEKGKNKKIPTDKLDFFSDLFSVSVAYLLGLINDDSIYVDKSQYYFWEHPKSRFKLVEKEVIEKSLAYPLETWGCPTEDMLDYIVSELRTDYELLGIIHHIFKVKETSQKDIRGVFKAIDKIL